MKMFRFDQSEDHHVRYLRGFCRVWSSGSGHPSRQTPRNGASYLLLLKISLFPDLLSPSHGLVYNHFKLISWTTFVTTAKNY